MATTTVMDRLQILDDKTQILELFDILIQFKNQKIRKGFYFSLFLLLSHVDWPFWVNELITRNPPTNRHFE